jgi:hypothetical protein
MTARLVEAGSWVFFDVLARDAASGAHVAMALREAVPGATIRSTPDASPSAEEPRPHLLHCRASMPASTAEQTRAVLAAALATVDALDAHGEEPSARVVLKDDAAAQAARAA